MEVESEQRTEGGAQKHQEDNNMEEVLGPFAVYLPSSGFVLKCFSREEKQFYDKIDSHA